MSTHVYTTDAKGKHGIFESSKLKATDVGKIFDLVFDEDVDNGVAVKVGDPTYDGLQTRKGTIADKGDKIAVTGSSPDVKDAVTKAQSQPYNFTNVAGAPVKCYQVLEEENEIFAVASYQFSTIVGANKLPKEGNYVVVDGKGGYVEVAASAKPEDTTYGFIGRVHSVVQGNALNMVRIECIKNAQV